MKTVCLFALMIVFCAPGASAHATTTPLNQDSLNVITAQLAKQNGVVGACRDVQLSLNIKENPIGQSTPILNFHFIDSYGRPYNYDFQMPSSAEIIGEFDPSGTGFGKIYSSHGTFAVPVCGLIYTKGQITGLILTGMDVGACSQD